MRPEDYPKCAQAFIKTRCFSGARLHFSQNIDLGTFYLFSRFFGVLSKQNSDRITAMNFPNGPSRRALMILLALAVLATFGGSQTPKPPKTDQEIKHAVIAESIAEYRATRGNCPCPFNTDSAGHQCGARSAYSRPGGASPLCYEKDVTAKMVEEYRRSHK
jgi:hypothetical protein